MFPFVMYKSVEDTEGVKC